MAVTLFVVTMSYDFVSSMLYTFVSLCIIHSYSVAVLLEWLAEVPIGVLVWMWSLTGTGYVVMVC